MANLDDYDLIRPDVETCRDLFQIGYEAYESSRIESLEVQDMYHNRQWTADQMARLSNRGQPAETFNVIKLFTRMILGYYSTVVNTAVASPTRYQDVAKASVINDLLDHAFRINDFITEGDEIKLDGFLSGVMCSEVTVKDTGGKDQFGRPIRRIVLNAINSNEIVLDPYSRKTNYSDARCIHRFKWISEDDVIKLYGEEKLGELYEYYNHLNVDEAEFEYSYNGQFTGRYKIFNNYLIVHTTLIDYEGKVWNIHWNDEVELYKKEMTHKNVKFPYRVQKLHTSQRTEHYGIFREVIESQKAINQALIKLQLMANTHKAFVEDGAVDNIDDFTDAFNRVNAVIQVNDLQGIKIENMSKEIVDQYTIIDKAFDRIQRVLGINDSFLGMAFASDSGRKVKLQQNATIISLHYLTNRIKQFYNSLGEDMVGLIQQYYTAEESLRIVDDSTGERWLAINQPMEIPTGGRLPTGEIATRYAFEYVLDDAGIIKVDDEGNNMIQPIPEEATEINVTIDIEINIESTAYNDEDEKNQLMLETILSSSIGQLLSQVNPAGFFKAAGLSLKSYKTKHSPDIAKILDDTANMLGGDPEAAQSASMMAQGGGQGGGQGGSLSQSLKLPQNTNEGVE